MDASIDKIEVLLEERKRLQIRLELIECEIHSLQMQNSQRPKGRPRGSMLPHSMDSLIVKSLDNKSDGLTFSGIVLSILQLGYKTTASPEDFKKMVKSRISCLKRKNKIVQDSNALVFRLFEN